MVDFGNQMGEPARRLAAGRQAGKPAPRVVGPAGGGNGRPRLLSALGRALGRTTPWDTNWKRRFGSSFTFDDIDRSLPLAEGTPPFHRPLAKGGLSNVWGAACYSFHRDQLRDWPVDPTTLVPHYTRIADSLGFAPDGVRLLDNDMFVLPLVKASRWRPFTPEVPFTLSQLVLVFDDRRVCDQTVHIQLYSYSDFAYASFTPVLERLPGPLRSWLRYLVYNTFIAAGYLHSNHSRVIRAGIVPCPARGFGSLRIHWEERRLGTAVVRRVVRHLIRARRALDVVPLGWALKTGGPGFSGHLAGSLPMRERPGPLETRPDGRLAATRTVWVADQSTFPTLPAQNPTYTAMANAHRIATEFARGHAPALEVSGVGVEGSV